MENEDIANLTAEILDCNRQQTNLTFFYHVSLGPAVSTYDSLSQEDIMLSRHFLTVICDKGRYMERDV